MTLDRLCHAALEVIGRKIAEGRVPTMRVVPSFNEIEDRGPSFLMVLEAMERQQLALERRIETLAHRVVVTIANRSHRRPDARLLAVLAERDRRVLATLV